MQTELGAHMQSSVFQESVDQHPNDIELAAYCERVAISPDAIDDDEFQKFEGHLLVCDACVERAKSFEVKWKSPKVRTAGSPPF
jgi:hypothetical protein